MQNKYLIQSMIIIIVSIYGCTEKSITMPEDINKIEYSINDDFIDFLLGEVHFIDELNGWINYMSGQGLLKTSDDGNSWKNVYFDSKSGPSAFYFINSNMGWFIHSIKGEKIAVLLTNNAGESWSDLYTFNNEVSSPSYVSVDFVNDSIGWVSMCSDIIPTLEIFKTANGGRDWILQKSDIKPSYFQYNNFVNENTGWISTNSDIYKTRDGGQSWISQGENIPKLSVNSPPSFGKTDFIDEYTGFIIQSGHELFRTDDGGYTWIRIYNGKSISPNNGQNSQTQYCYDFFNSYLGAIAGDSLYITNDGGKSWEFIYGVDSDADNHISSLCFAGKNTLFAVDKNNNILRFIIQKLTDPAMI